MEISPRKSSKRTQEHVDEWLSSQGYFRKHVPRDPTCLFRAISEQVYLTQYYHVRVRRECVEFMRENRNLFEECITIPFDMYLEQMTCFTEAGGSNEIQAMSLLYKREVILFNGQKQTCKQLTNYGFTKYIRLCYTPQKQYESVYSKDFVMEAGFCQSIIYEILYKDVFDMENLDNTVYKMLHNRDSTLRHDRFFSKGNLEMREELSAEVYKRLENSCEGTLDCFPTEIKNAGWIRYNSNGLQIGDKCLIEMDFDKSDLDKCDTKAIKDGRSSNENQKYKKLSSASSSKTKEQANYEDNIFEKNLDECSITAIASTSGTAKMTTPLLAASTAATLMKITDNDSYNEKINREDLPALQWQKQEWNNQGQMVGENSLGKLQNYTANKNAPQFHGQGNTDKKTKTGKGMSKLKKKMR